jgi:hypothetical protein
MYGTIASSHNYNIQVKDSLFRMSKNQQMWLDNDLATNRNKPKIILLHAKIDQNYPGNPAYWSSLPY